MSASILYYRRVAHTKPEGNLHALTYFKCTRHYRGFKGIRKFVARQHAHSATSSSETRETPILASCVSAYDTTGQGSHPSRPMLRVSCLCGTAQGPKESALDRRELVCALVDHD